jgi:hypothetical protein
MALDFVGFINSVWTATPEEKQAMLEDFTDALGYSGPEPIPGPPPRAEFANAAIQHFVVNTVNRYRRNEAIKAVIWEELDLDS